MDSFFRAPGCKYLSVEEAEKELAALRAWKEKAVPYLERELENTIHFLRRATIEIADMKAKGDFTYQTPQEGEFLSKQDLLNGYEEEYYELRELLEEE